MNLLIDYARKTRLTLDMGGYPDEVETDETDFTKTKAIEVYEKPQHPSFMEMKMNHKLTVYFNMGLTESQINQAVIDYFCNNFVRY